MTDDFLDVTDAYGRPVLLRRRDIAVIEGATDPTDPHADLWGQHPLTPYRRITLSSGHLLYLADTRDLLDQLTAYQVRDPRGQYAAPTKYQQKHQRNEPI